MQKFELFCSLVGNKFQKHIGHIMIFCNWGKAQGHQRNPKEPFGRAIAFPTFIIDIVIQILENSYHLPRHPLRRDLQLHPHQALPSHPLQLQSHLYVHRINQRAKKTKT